MELKFYNVMCGFGAGVKEDLTYIPCEGKGENRQKPNQERTTQRAMGFKEEKEDFSSYYE